MRFFIFHFLFLLIGTQTWAEPPISQCNENSFLVEWYVRSSCEDSKANQCDKNNSPFVCPTGYNDCLEVDLAQRTDDPSQIIQFLASTKITTEQLKAARAKIGYPTGLKKLTSDYRHDMNNSNFVRQTYQEYPEMREKFATDPNYKKEQIESFTKRMAKKANLYRALGFEMPDPPPEPPMSDGELPAYELNNPVENFLRAREQALQESRSGGGISKLTRDALKTNWRALRDFKAGGARSLSLEPEGAGGRVGNVGSMLFLIGLDYIDPGPIKKYDVLRALCPAPNFKAYDAAPKEIKELMEMDNCKLKFNPHAIQSILSSEPAIISAIDRTPALCQMMQDQLEELRTKQGLYRSGRIIRTNSTGEQSR